MSMIKHLQKKQLIKITDFFTTNNFLFVKRSDKFVKVFKKSACAIEILKLGIDHHQMQSIIKQFMLKNAREAVKITFT